MDDYSPDVEAEIVFLPTQEGGRQGPAQSGYRALFFFDGEFFDAVYEFIGTDSISPGQTTTAHIRLLHPELLYDRLYLDDQFGIQEGTRTVARGRITSVLDIVNHAENLRGPKIAAS